MFAYGNILSVLMQSDKTSEGSHIDLFMRKALNDWMRFSMYQAIHGAPPPLGYATLRCRPRHDSPLWSFSSLQPAGPMWNQPLTNCRLVTTERSNCFDYRMDQMTHVGAHTNVILKELGLKD
jgi:crotonobetainyl-CoA:carnitine CoA-transferase CaiB-like acyl-CoA transferase